MSERVFKLDDAGNAAGPRTLGSVVRADDGQDLAEYAILIGLIALVVIGAVTAFGGAVAELFQDIVGDLPFN